MGTLGDSPLQASARLTKESPLELKKQESSNESFKSCQEQEEIAVTGAPEEIFGSVVEEKPQQENEQAEIDKEYMELKKLVTIPYLQPLDPQDDRYTLVLDLDETLIHFEIDEDVPDEEEPGYYLIRPGAIKFL